MSNHGTQCRYGSIIVLVMISGLLCRTDSNAETLCTPKMAAFINHAYAPILKQGDHQTDFHPGITVAIEAGKSLNRMLMHPPTNRPAKCVATWNIFTGDSGSEITNFSLREIPQNNACHVLADFDNAHGPVSVDFRILRKKQYFELDDITTHTAAGIFDLRSIVLGNGTIGRGECLEMSGVYY